MKVLLCPDRSGPHLELLQKHLEAEGVRVEKVPWFGKQTPWSLTQLCLYRLAGFIRHLPVPGLAQRQAAVAAGLEQMGRDWQTRLHWLRQHGKRRWVWACLLGLGHGATRLAILPAAAWALHLPIDPAPLVLWAGVVYYGLAFVPLPGGGGTTELASLFFLNQYLSSAEAALLLAVWRVSDYYLRLGLGGLAVLGLMRQ